tara:strand:+ start:8673 stop:9374 length:702 start_codon:yes stop_codon:yes gene_type:complete
MSLHLSIKSLKITDLTCLIQSGFSIALMFSLPSCSAIKSNDYSVKDSLYVWSDSFDESTEADTEYQTISSLEESILKSDVQLIFEAMVNNEIAEIDLLEKERMPEIPASFGLAPNQEVALVETSIDRASKLDTETILEAQNPYVEMETVAAINRLTQENPTAAGIPVSKVIPSINTEMSEIELPNEILLLAGPADYDSDVNEYGMWQLVKGDNSPYQEVCSLSSSTMQVEGCR